MSETTFTIGDVEVGLDSPLFVMAGPCVIETKEISLTIAERLVEIGCAADVPIIFKASFDKANRSSIFAMPWESPLSSGKTSIKNTCRNGPKICR